LGTRLYRLLAHRRPSFQTSIWHLTATLARDAGVAGSDLAAVINDGAEPNPELVRRLAPVLGFYTADMFVLAGLPVPAELASAWPTSPWNVGSILQHAVRMNAAQRSQLVDLIRSLPSEPRTEPAPPDGFPDTTGALLVRLAINRNIRPRNAKIVKQVGGGPYVSDSTVWMLGMGRVVLTPLYVTAFAHILGYDPGDLVALVGVGPVVEDAPAHRASAELAALAWTARLLTSDQIGHVLTAARELGA